MKAYSLTRGFDRYELSYIQWLLQQHYGHIGRIPKGIKADIVNDIQ
jgi:hypothetical protein